MVADDRINIAALREALELGIVDDVMRETPRVLDRLIQEKHGMSAAHDLIASRHVETCIKLGQAEARLAEAEDVIETAWYRIRNDDDLARDLQCLRDFLAGGEE